MFKSVIERQRAGRLGTGLWVSTAAHALLFVAVLFISARPQDLPPELEKEYTLKLAPGPRQPKGNPPAALPQKQAVAQRPRPRNPNVMPREVRPLTPEPVKPPEPDPAPSTNTDEVANTGDGPVGHPDGDPNAIGLPYVPGLPAGPGSDGTGTDVLPFGTGMTPPLKLSGPSIDYTPQALVAGVQGTMIAKCVITEEGRVRDCRIIKGLPHMDEAVIDALEHQRYRPVTFQGRAVSVSYVFTLRLKPR